MVKWGWKKKFETELEKATHGLCEDMARKKKKHGWEKTRHDKKAICGTLCKYRSEC